MSDWILIIRVSGEEPIDYELKSGVNSIGRGLGNDIYIDDESASRQHAEINFDLRIKKITIHDCGSTNGTFVNRQRLTKTKILKNKDIIRIGSSVLKLVQRGASEDTRTLSGTQYFSREQVLESLDHHAVLMYEISERLNVVTDIETALFEVSELMQKAMGAHKCSVILADQFDNLQSIGFPRSIADAAITSRSAVVIPDQSKIQGGSAQLIGIQSAMCIPVLVKDEVIGLIYMYKTDPEERPFNKNDLEVAIAISHQAALVIQRMQLINRVQEEQNVRRVLQRFISPQEAQFFLEDLDDNTKLPGLSEKKVSVMFADVADSTMMAEKLGPRKFGELLDAFYQALTEIVFAHDGVVRYLGDGVMAVFGMVGTQTKFEINAVRAGIVILSKLTHFVTGFDIDLVIGISITSGQAVIGYVGTDQRVELTVLGDTVNLAARLQQYARPNRLLIDSQTVEALEERFLVRRLPAVKVRGRQAEELVYEVFSESGKWSEIFFIKDEYEE